MKKLLIGLMIFPCYVLAHQTTLTEKDFLEAENTSNEFYTEIKNTGLNDFLKQFADENDSKLNDEGGFDNSENFYECNENTFVINFFSISQDDFLEKYELFEELGAKLKEKIGEIVDVREVVYADDCPIVFFEIDNTI